MKNIKLSSKPLKIKNKAVLNFRTVRQAAKNGLKYVFLDLGKRRGVFRIVGGRKNPRIRMVADLSRRRVRIRPTRTLEPAVRAALRKIPEFYEDALLFQLRRAKLIR